MLKLFIVLLGGRAENCNVELHDVVFTVGRTIEETYPQLVKKWFGNVKRLHIDSTMEFESIDGHEIVINEEKPTSPNENKLFFVNFGGYRKGHFGELHESTVYVAPSKTEALAKAKKDLGIQLEESHCDDNLVVDDLIGIEKIDQYYLHLIPTQKAPNIIIKSFYRRLDVVETVV